MEINQSKYTERARKVLMLAQEEARRFHHDYLGTEHLLLGLAAVEQGVAGKVLSAAHVSVERIREAMIMVLGPSTGPLPEDLVPTARLARVLALAAHESSTLGHTYIGTEHLLLGLLRTDDHDVREALSTKLLDSLDVDMDTLRRSCVQQLMGSGPSTGRTRDHVVTCRVTDQALGALDAFVEAGVYATRSEAAARLIVAGIDANQGLLEKVYTAAAEIRRVRDATQALTQDWVQAEG